MQTFFLRMMWRQFVFMKALITGTPENLENSMVNGGGGSDRSYYTEPTG